MIEEQTSRDTFCGSPRDRWKHLAASSLVFTTLLCLALALSWRDGAFRGEFGDHPDEAAQYVTGLMFHDYFESMHYSSPVNFAENYYLHYPKVAIGHWPPVFFVIQGIWTLLFSASRFSLMFLMATLLALLAFTLYRTLAREFGGPVALSASLVFVALPAVRTQTGMVMADVPVALFSLLAATYFGRFLDTERRADVVGFGGFCILAVMTKASAVALALLPPLAIFLTRKWGLLRRPALWGSGAMVLIMCGPWYVWTLRMQRQGLPEHATIFSYSPEAIRFYGLEIIRILGWGLSFLTVIGLSAKLRSIRKPEEYGGTWAAMTGLLFAFFVLLSIVETGGPENRYLLPVIPAALAFAAGGLDVVGRSLRPDRLRPLYLSLGFVALLAMADFGMPLKRSYGFGPVAQMLVSQEQFRQSVSLVSSDTDGEGMFVSEVAMRERRPGHVILRASKVLADDQWQGGDYHSFFSTPQQVRQYLDSVPVEIILIDSSIPEELQQEHEKLLKQAITTSPDNWRLLAKYPVWRRGVEYPDALQAYVLVRPTEPAHGVVHLDMRRTLGKQLTLELSPKRKGD